MLEQIEILKTIASTKHTSMESFQSNMVEMWTAFTILFYFMAMVNKVVLKRSFEDSIDDLYLALELLVEAVEGK